jgi:hypothetical protein
MFKHYHMLGKNHIYQPKQVVKDFGKTGGILSSGAFFKLK